MVTLSMSDQPGKIIQIPGWTELREAMGDRAVAITAFVVGGILAALFVVCVTFLAYTGKGSEALTGAGMIGLITALVALYQRTKAQDGKLDKIEKHVADGGVYDGRSAP